MREEKNEKKKKRERQRERRRWLSIWGDALKGDKIRKRGESGLWGEKKEGKDQHFLLLISFSTGHTPASVLFA